MKNPRSVDVLPGSLPVWLTLRTNQSIFSLLLEIESRLRAENRATSVQCAQPRLGQGRNRRTEHLSRYIE
jgi:hypothetical protein